jgi:DNA-binding SARP family transcriptional activator
MVFGGMHVTASDGQPIATDDLPRRERQVLGVLAARHDRVQSKDALADAVWGEALPGNSAAAIEHYVSALRRRLQPGKPTAESCIVTRAGGYLLSTSRAELDLAELRDLVRTADRHPPGDPARVELRQRILALVTGPPFVEDEYAEWAEQARAETQDAVLAATVELAESSLADDPARALRLAQDALALDRFQERTYRIAMRASAALGRTDDALRWFERCRRTLGDELQLSPSPQTSRLRLELVRTHEATRPGSTLPVQADAHFYGRTREIALVLSGTARVIHLIGPIGAGKSALLAALARRTPGRVGVGTAIDTGGGALRLSWLRSALLQLGVASTTTVERAMSQQRPLLHDELEAVAAALPEGTVIGVDGAEKLDDDSVTELSWLVQHCPQATVVLAYRYPSAIVGSPVATIEADLVLRLAPLSVDELGDPALVALTGGIPGLVGAVEGPAADAVAMHLARVRTRWMPPLAWELLRLTATLDGLDADRLAELTHAPLTDVLECVDHLRHAHLVREEGGYIQHSSTLVRDAVAEQVSEAHHEHLRSRQLTL